LNDVHGIPRAWCKTIVTSYIKWGIYNSFAPSPRYGLSRIQLLVHVQMSSLLIFGITIMQRFPCFLVEKPMYNGFDKWRAFKAVCELVYKPEARVE